MGKKTPPARKIKVEPLSKEDREVLVRLAKSEHEPIQSNSICGPGRTQKK